MQLKFEQNQWFMKLKSLIIEKTEYRAKMEDFFLNPEKNIYPCPFLCL